jgi:hypothetical protein
VQLVALAALLYRSDDLRRALNARGSAENISSTAALVGYGFVEKRHEHELQVPHR